MGKLHQGDSGGRSLHKGDRGDKNLWRVKTANMGRAKEDRKNYGFYRKGP